MVHNLIDLLSFYFFVVVVDAAASVCETLRGLLLVELALTAGAAHDRLQCYLLLGGRARDQF
jgi:hypothetical protein